MELNKTYWGPFSLHLPSQRAHCPSVTLIECPLFSECFYGDLCWSHLKRVEKNFAFQVSEFYFLIFLCYRFHYLWNAYFSVLLISLKIENRLSQRWYYRFFGPDSAFVLGPVVCIVGWWVWWLPLCATSAGHIPFWVFPWLGFTDESNISQWTLSKADCSL